MPRASKGVSCGLEAKASIEDRGRHALGRLLDGLQAGPGLFGGELELAKGFNAEPCALAHLVKLVAQGDKGFDASYGESGQGYACTYGEALGRRPDSLEYLGLPRP